VKGPFYWQVAIFVALLLVGLFRFLYFESVGVKTSLAMLSSATGFFILTICVPMYFWGGSHRSMFGPLLASVSTLTVIVAKSPRVRVVFGLACGVFFIYLSLPPEAFPHIGLSPAFGYKDIFPVTHTIPGSRYTGVQLNIIFQTVATVLTILIAFILSWMHARDRTIFGDEAKIHPLRERANDQQRTEMVQTSIKFAVDIKNGVLAGGGQLHSECIKKLEEEMNKHQQVMDKDNVWCAEWAPATDELISNTLRSLSETEAPSCATTEIQDEVSDLAKSRLAKEKFQLRNLFQGKKH
jgi:hypothetical protein